MLAVANLHERAQLALAEHRLLEHAKAALAQVLSWSAERVSSPRKRASVCFVLRSFERHLHRLMALEEEEGYLLAVIHASPNAAGEVQQLAGDHERFRREVSRHATHLESLCEWQREDAEFVYEQIGSVLAAIDEHDAHEVRLLQETLLQDGGGEG